MAKGTGEPELQGMIIIERLKGGSDTSAKYRIDLLAPDASDGRLTAFRTGQLRNFDTTTAGYFDLLRACLNTAVGDAFYRRSQSTSMS